MTEAPDTARPAPPKAALLTRIVIILTVAFLALLGFVVLLGLSGAAFIYAWSLYWTYFPVYTAETRIEQLHATVQLEFYSSDEAADDESRHLTIRTPQGQVTVRMSTFDWAHNPRTSVYATDDRKIAVLGPRYEDHLIALDPLQAERAFRVPSDEWTYLGAFDLVSDPAGRFQRDLKFFSASEEPECIPMRSEVKHHDWAPRNAARARDCPRR